MEGGCNKKAGSAIERNRLVYLIMITFWTYFINIIFLTALNFPA
jgi:hypothetical protein